MNIDGYADWLRANPAPDLQELVARFGGYSNITAEAWATYDRAMAEWEESPAQPPSGSATHGVRSRPGSALHLRARRYLHEAAQAWRAADLAL